MMKKICAVLCCLMLFAVPLLAQYAAAEAVPMDDYTGLLGCMEIVNCKKYATMRVFPDSSSEAVCRVPLGEVVTNCWYEDERFTYCEYDGMSGYILNSTLSFISGPVGQEYTEEEYLGNMYIANCQSYASLRSYPDTRADLIARVPLGSIVTNVFYENDRFCYCMFGDLEGFILSDNLMWLSGGPLENYLGDCVIINCISFASLRAYPDTASDRLCKVPLGAEVTDCWIVNDRFAQCTYGDLTGYILLSNLGQYQ